MKADFICLLIRVAADAPDLSQLITIAVALSAELDDGDRPASWRRLKATCKGYERGRLDFSDAYAALKVHVDDLTDQL